MPSLRVGTTFLPFESKWAFDCLEQKTTAEMMLCDFQGWIKKAMQLFLGSLEYQHLEPELPCKKFKYVEAATL